MGMVMVQMCCVTDCLNPAARNGDYPLVQLSIGGEAALIAGSSAVVL